MKKNNESQPNQINSEDSHRHLFYPNELRNSVTLQRMILHISEHRKNMENARDIFNPENFLELHDLCKRIESDHSLSENQKSLNGINEALREMVDAAGRGKVKFGFIYPIIRYWDKELKISLKVLGAQSGKVVTILPYRTSFMDHSKSQLDKYLAPENYSADSDYIKNPQKFLFMDGKNSLKYNPYGLSLSNQIFNKLREAFAPYSPLHLIEFQKDLFDYFSQSSYVKRLTPEYHVKNSSINFDENFNLLNEPEELFHLRNLVIAQESVAERVFLPLLKSLKMDVSFANLNSYYSMYSNPLSNDPGEEMERIEQLIISINQIPNSDKFSQDDQKVLEALKAGNELINILLLLIPHLKNEIDNLKRKARIQSAFNKIVSHNAGEKTLFRYNLHNPLENFEPKIENESLAKELDAFLKKNLFYRKVSPEYGVDFLYFLAPDNALQVVHNLARLTSNGVSKFKEQYEVSKELYYEMTGSKLENLNTAIPSALIPKLESEIAELDEKQIKQEKSLSFKDRFNRHAAYLTILIGLILSIFLFIHQDQPIILFLSIPLSLFLGFVMGIVFQKRDKEENYSEKFKKDLIPIYEKAKYYINLPGSNPETRIFTRSKLQLFYKDYLLEIRTNLKDFQNETDDRILNLLVDSGIKFCVAFKLPEKAIPEGSPDTEIYIPKVLLKNETSKNAILESVQKMYDLAGDSNTRAMYGYLNKILRQDLSNYL
ncbi:MAG: hypothetical protein H7A24_02525 [Leptospiraceae bacterium]|nr:hypothetical protein [Leptospiraceae bacterium]MCP5510725.1 hypothetical protein [Leptospiraceae bacterium]